MQQNHRHRAYYFVVANAVAWLLYGIYAYLMGEIWSASVRHQMFQVPFTIVSGFTVTYLLRKIYKLAWSLPLKFRLLVCVTAFLTIVFVYTWISAEFSYAVVEGARNTDPKHLIGWGKYNFFVLGSWSGLYLSGKYYLLYQLAERNRERAEALTHKTRLEMLRYQLNPHFLFNTLNAINTLVLDKQNDLAVKTLAELSRFLRFSLDASKVNTISLEQEIELIKDYLNIESIRFGERFKIEYDLDEKGLQCLVPPMLLQPLAENTVKYAVSVVTYPITLKISSRLEGSNLTILVVDNGPGSEINDEQQVRQDGVGLRNIRERLEFYFNGSVQCSFSNIEPRGFESRLVFPAITEEEKSSKFTSWEGRRDG